MAAPQLRSLRLNYNLRYSIINAAVNDLFGEQFQKKDRLFEGIAKEAYDMVYTPEVLKNCESSGTSYSTYGASFRIRNSGRDGVDVYIAGFKTYQFVNHTVVSDDLYTRYQEFCALGDNLNKEVHKLRQALNELLNRCTTTKQLIEAWPDGKKYITKMPEAVADGALNHKRRLAAAKVAGIFLDAGVDVVTDTEVTEDAGKQDQTA